MIGKVTLRKWIVGLGSLVVLTLVSSLSLKADALEPRKHAFTVGINEYTGFGGTRDLKLPVADAKAVNRVLRRLNYSSKKPILNPTRRQFLDEWEDFLRTVQMGDIVLVYLSGHGVRIDGINYFLPSDVRHLDHRDRSKIKGDSIAIHSLFAEVSERLPRIAVFIIDACRDDPYLADQYRLSTKTLTTHRQAGLSISAPEGVFVLYAAGPGQAAIERFEKNDWSTNSLFTRHLLPLLRRANLKLTDLAKEVQTKVYNAARAQGRRQTPAYRDSIVGEFCLGGCSDHVVWPSKLAPYMGKWRTKVLVDFRIDLKLDRPKSRQGTATAYVRKDNGSGVREFVPTFFGKWSLNTKTNVVKVNWKKQVQHLLVLDKSKSYIRLKVGKSTGLLGTGKIITLRRK